MAATDATLLGQPLLVREDGVETKKWWDACINASRLGISTSEVETEANVVSSLNLQGIRTIPTR